MAASDEKEMDFGEHLEELRKMFFRMVVSLVIFTGIAFCLKDILFGILLAPQQEDFILYRLLDGLAPESTPDFRTTLINTELTGQFMTHMKISLYTGLLLAGPYLIYELFRFISPGLHVQERRSCLQVLFPAFCCFASGLLANYFLIFPLSYRFLATYQVSDSVTNLISLTSYVSSFTLLSLFMGASFEIPVLAWLLARLGLIRPDILKRYRRHALVAILTLAAVITPTSDIFTLLVVSLPLYLLYEVSIGVVSRTRGPEGA